MEKDKSLEIKDRVRLEIQAALREKDQWLLVHLSRKPDGTVSIGSDTVFGGFENSRELRGPRWQSLSSAREFKDQGFKWIVAGELSAAVLFRQLLNGVTPPGVIMHIRSVKRWAPECAEFHPTLNSVQGFVNPSLPENKSLAARRPGKKKRDELKASGCSCCGSKTEVTLHHLIPREMGGATEEDNLLAVCRPCHDAIHSGDLDVTDLVLQVNLKRVKNLISSISSAETKTGA